jgi:hypothetical protein
LRRPEQEPAQGFGDPGVVAFAAPGRADEVEADRPFVFRSSIDFADAPPQSISGRGVSQHFFRDADSEARPGQTVRRRVHDEQIVGDPALRREHAVELRFSANSLGGAETLIALGRLHGKQRLTEFSAPSSP